MNHTLIDLTPGKKKDHLQWELAGLGMKLGHMRKRHQKLSDDLLILRRRYRQLAYAYWDLEARIDLLWNCFIAPIWEEAQKRNGSNVV